MDAAQIEGHHLWREFLGAVLPTISSLLQTVAQQLDAVAVKDPS